MKNGVYITTFGKNVSSGVTKKIDNQIKIFSEFSNVKYINIPKKRGMIRRILSILPGGSFSRDYPTFFEMAQKERFDYVYIRQVEADRKYIDFIKKIRLMFPDSKIVMEFPTYPYDSDLFHSKTMWPWFYKDVIYRRKLKKYIDRIVTFSDDKEIFGIKTIRTMNGIDVRSTRLADILPEDKVIRMIGVAMMQPYHGFERLIMGLSSYYENGGDRDIQITFVGYGSELDYYKKLVKDTHLSNHVIFTGKKQGEELDKLYDGCDLGIGSMGGYKIGIEVFSSIKLGEYLAKGLPVVTGARTLIFDRFGDKYNLNFPNNNSQIDISKVVEFYDSVYNGKDKIVLRNRIRDFALSAIDIKVVMRDIIDYLEA